MFRIICLIACALIVDSEPNASSSPQDDETALLQHGLHVKRRTHESLATSKVTQSRPPSGSLVQRLLDVGTFDCNAHPGLCKPPFDCHELSSEDIHLWLQEGAARQGVPNYKLWCALPHYEAYASRCAAGDLDGAGKLQFQLTASGHFGELVREMDGSMCFIEGHCANSKVTNETTIQDAVSMCDDRFGREAWSKWGSAAMPLEDHLDYDLPEDLSMGFQTREQARPMLLAACAMGNLHCDVRYCRETYCKEEYYVEKYGHLSKKFGWVQ